MKIYQRLEAHNLFVGITNVVFSLIMAILGLRFIFRLFAANSNAPFVRWLYDTSDSLLYPFRNIFASPAIDGGFVFDIPALVAIVIYGLMLSLAVYLFDLFFGVKRV